MLKKKKKKSSNNCQSWLIFNSEPGMREGCSVSTALNVEIKAGIESESEFKLRA